ncbi:MAG TPA: reverse transcriptase domain-containing protein [Fusibacter sp.]|nr:reverse transcriptase domain-containing protein [Fusibacter sp.]
METKKVWKVCLKTSIPAKRKVIGNRWVFNKKDDGRYRARTVAQGFSQIPGKDFQEKYAPVVNDATFCLVLALKLMLGLDSGQFDVETAFLYGDLDEELWMELPEGYDKYVKETHNQNIRKDTHCVLLKKALYGLVQAARQWWKKFKDVMATIGFHTSAADPCLFVKQETKGEPNSFVIIYVDDGGVIGTKKVIKEIFEALSKDFKIKNLGKMEHFVGCHIIENNDKDTIWIHQPKLIKNLKLHFSRSNYYNKSISFTRVT